MTVVVDDVVMNIIMTIVIQMLATLATIIQMLATFAQLFPMTTPTWTCHRCTDSCCKNGRTTLVGH